MFYALPLFPPAARPLASKLFFKCIYFFGKAKYLLSLLLKHSLQCLRVIYSSVAIHCARGLGYSSEQNTDPALMEHRIQADEQEIDQSDIYKLYRCLICCCSYYYYHYNTIQMRN